jgi:hypothetical protein
VDADIASRSLLIRGTNSQVEQIRALLRKLGETDEEGGGGLARSREHVRLLPLSGSAARSAIMQIEQIWPSVRSNRIRVVTPTATIPSYRPSESPAAAPSERGPLPSARGTAEPIEDLWQIFLNSRSTAAPEPAPTNPAKPAVQPGESEQDSDDVTAAGAGAAPRKNVYRFAADQLPDDELAQDVAEDAARAVPSTERPIEVQLPGAGAPVLIAPGPGGTIIASDDLEALDDLEELLSVVASKTSTTGREYAVYYLKYSKAATIAEVLAAIFGGKAGGNDRGIIGDMANNALGNMGGALMGDLLLGGGGGGGGFTSATVDIVPDARLNALVVHAKPADLDTIEELLKVLDQRHGPEDVEAETQPRPIPVYNTEASEVAAIIQQVYADRMAGGSGVMSPQEMMRMIRGGPNVEQQVPKMSIAVDERNNLLIVRAPDPLFEEIKSLVANLDQALLDSPETTRVVSLKHTNSAAVQRALTSILDNVTTSTSSSTTDGTRRRDRDDDDDDSPEERARRAMRRNWEMMQEMRRMQERMGGERGGPGGFRGRGGDDGDRGGDRPGRGDSRRGRD